MLQRTIYLLILRKDSLRRQADTVLRATGELIILLVDTRKKDAEVVKKRIEEAIRTYLVNPEKPSSFLVGELKK